jgi:hypothetical protein
MSGFLYNMNYRNKTGQKRRAMSLKSDRPFGSLQCDVELFANSWKYKIDVRTVTPFSRTFPNLYIRQPTVVLQRRAKVSPLFSLIIKRSFLAAEYIYTFICL